jgi:hypothetical protein
MEERFLTAGELADLLRGYDPAAPILMTWEGTFHPVRPGDVYASRDGVVLLDADDNFLKETLVAADLRKSPRWPTMPPT